MPNNDISIIRNFGGSYAIVIYEQKNALFYKIPVGVNGKNIRSLNTQVYICVTTLYSIVTPEYTISKMLKIKTDDK